MNTVLFFQSCNFIVFFMLFLILYTTKFVNYTLKNHNTDTKQLVLFHCVLLTYSYPEIWLKQRQEDNHMIKYIYYVLAPPAGLRIPIIIDVKPMSAEPHNHKQNLELDFNSI